MAQPEYKDIRDGDWENLRQFARRANERLSVLEGYSGESSRLANLKMDGNQIRNGPWHQTTAESDEFVTKYMIDQQILLARNLMTRQKTVMSQVIDVVHGPIYLTDFSETSGYWLPLYCWGHNGGTGNLVFNANGSVDVEAMGPDDFGVQQQFVMGVRSRFRIIPDENQDIDIQVRFINPTWNARGAGNGNTFMGMLLDRVINSTVGGVAYIGQGVYGPNSVTNDTVVTGQMSNLYNSLFVHTSNTAVPSAMIPIQIRWQFKWSTAVSPERLYPLSPQWFNGSTWDGPSVAISTDAGWLNNWYGISPILGVFQLDQEYHKATLVEFFINKGILVKMF
jgi:hypothetical protein